MILGWPSIQVGGKVQVPLADIHNCKESGRNTARFAIGSNALDRLQAAKFHFWLPADDAPVC